VKKALWLWGGANGGVVLGIILAIISTPGVSAQVLMSGGTYTQNFDMLAGTGTANTWTDNDTLPGWYASTNAGGSRFGTVTIYRAGAGAENNGALYSFGDVGSAERALGSLASGTPGDFAWGVRFTNDTASAQTNFTISYTGEQWRVGNTNIHKLTFCYQVGASLTNADAPSNQVWTAFTALDFNNPTTNGTSRALVGNQPTNQVVFTNVVLAGVVVLPGQELFLRWFDPDDTGFDDGLGIDNLTVSFQATNGSSPNVPPYITTQPQSQTVNEGDTVAFTVVAGGTAPLRYQWQSNNIPVTGATNDTFSLAGVTAALSGDTYFVTITNAAGATNSQAATLIVNPPPATNDTFSVLTYNMKGNGAADWSTNATQVQAIARQLVYFNPDIISFNEIPNSQYWEMTNWVTAFLPAYTIVVSHGTDGFIRNGIGSRFPITYWTNYLDGAGLTNFGYNGKFTRDLLEARIAVPGFSRPLHVFVAHLKSGTSSSDDAARRAAEASAITNFFATNLFVLHPYDPYLLAGDMNEDIADPATGSQEPIQRLTNGTGLVLTTPLNPITHTSFTFSIRGALTNRYDYIFPCRLLSSNIVSSQVPRTDLLYPVPSGLNSNDNKVASDHLPVLMTFANPYTRPFRLTSFTRSNSAVTLQWEALPGQNYRVEWSSNLDGWATLADNLAATNYSFLLSTNRTNAPQFFRVRRLN
jgi:endonuclease/exonuclease/phosphatase family metal-dependent hydrolase